MKTSVEMAFLDTLFEAIGASSSSAIAGDDSITEDEDSDRRAKMLASLLVIALLVTLVARRVEVGRVIVSSVRMYWFVGEVIGRISQTPEFAGQLLVAYALKKAYGLAKLRTPDHDQPPVP